MGFQFQVKVDKRKVDFIIKIKKLIGNNKILNNTIVITVKNKCFFFKSVP